MEWTRDSPSEPGLYWCCDEGGVPFWLSIRQNKITGALYAEINLRAYYDIEQFVAYWQLIPCPQPPQRKEDQK